MLQELRAKDRDGLSRQQDAVATAMDADFPAAFRSLIGHEQFFIEAVGPERSKTTMSRSGDRIFGDSGPGGEKFGDEIISSFSAPARDHVVRGRTKVRG